MGPWIRVSILITVLLVAMSGNSAAQISSQLGADCEFPYTSTDATGHALTIAEQPDRIIALAPSAAQTLWEIGAQQQVIGMPVNQYTSDLAGYTEPRNINNPDDATVNIELVVNLTPDLVLAPAITPSETIDRLRAAGLTVYQFEAASSINDVYEKTERTGRLTGYCQGAADRVGWMRDRIEAVESAVADEPRPLVVYPIGGGFVAGNETFLHEIIEAAGGRNLAAEAGITGYERISPEVIVTRNPEWVILNRGLPRSAIQRDAYNQTVAFKRNQTITVNPNYANQPAPRIVYPIVTIAQRLHPAAIPETYGPSSVAEPASPVSDRPTPSETARTTPVTPSDGQTGFAFVVTIVALLATVMARRNPRRR